MHDPSATESPNLEQLYQLTIDILSDEDHITRALDWVDTVLPLFAAACRAEVGKTQTTTGRVQSDAIEQWLEWLDGDDVFVIEEAGKGEMFDWRVRWLRILLNVTLRLLASDDCLQPATRKAIAEEAWKETPNRLACFPRSFWLHLIEYLCSAAVQASDSEHQSSPHVVAFPLVLSEPVVDGGTETNVIIAQFILEASNLRTGEVYLAPEQTVMRGLDERFAQIFRSAAAAAKTNPEGLTDELPSVSVRIQTMQPGHERFLCGTILRGDSGGGALAVALRQIFTGRGQTDGHLAISFALSAGANPVDGRCHDVGGTDDKVRGCAKQHVTYLLVARSQQQKLAIYGHKHNVQILGATTVAEAAETAGGVSRAGGMPRVTPPPPLPRTDRAQVLPTPAYKKIVILHYRRAERDRRISKLMEDHLKNQGHSVFVDRYVDVGITWAKEIDEHIRDADVVIPLLSAASIVSETLASEVLTADEARQKNGSKPRLVPVRVNYSGPMPDNIAYVTESLPPVMWRSELEDDNLFLQAIDAAVGGGVAGSTAEAQVRRSSRVAEESSGMKPEAKWPAAVAEESAPYPASPEGGKPAAELAVDLTDLEPFAGLVPLSSRFYIERDTDAPFLRAVDQRHSVILVKGARQMGKSSLLARCLARAEQSGVRVVLTDIQKLSVADLQSLKGFYLAVARMLARQLKLEAGLDETWVEHRSPNLNFEEYFEDHILPAVGGEIVWAMDEVDKLFFTTDFSSDVFGLLRSWANEGQGRVTSPWAKVSMVIAYATEAHLFITDANQSPFNVGTRFEMKDFTRDQVAELNRRYGSPMAAGADFDEFYDLVGGHPYLVRRSLYSMVTESINVRQLTELASGDNGPLSDHLRRLVALLARNEENVLAIRDILSGRPCPSYEAFYHLRSAGVLLGDTAQHATIRCNLYRLYLSRHLQ